MGCGSSSATVVPEGAQPAQKQEKQQKQEQKQQQQPEKPAAAPSSAPSPKKQAPADSDAPPPLVKSELSPTAATSAPAPAQSSAPAPAADSLPPVGKGLAPLSLADTPAKRTFSLRPTASGLASPPRKAAFDPKALKVNLAAAPIARPTLASPKAAYNVDSLFKAAHEGHDMGKKAALLFAKFDADHNGILDVDELAALTKAMLEHTLRTLIDANKDCVEQAIKQRPEDEETIRHEAETELQMIIPYANSQIARAAEIAQEIANSMDSDGNGQIDKEEFITQVTDCLKTYADFNVC